MDTLARPPGTHLHVPASLRSLRSLRSLPLLVAEARPAVQAVFLLRFASLAVYAPEPSPAVLLAAAGWLLLTTAIYVVNGLSDLAGDRLNGSSRPLASDRVDAATARSAATACALAGVGVSWGFSPGLGVLAVAMLALGLGYSYGPCWKAGRHAASVVIGGGAALTYLAGAVVAGVASWQLVAGTTAVAVWVAVASISKDFSDVVGDRVAGRRTFPVELGPAAAARLVALGTASAASLLLAVSLAVDLLTLAAGVVAGGTAVLAGVLTTMHRPGSRLPARAPYRVYMLTQYTACAVLIGGAVV